MKKRLSDIPLLLLLLFVVPPAAAQHWSQELDSVLTILAEQEIFSGQVLLAEKDSIVFYNGYGNYRNDPIGTATALPIASVSKPITAFGIMILKEQGKLTYDDKITEYLPKIPFHNVTIRQLLNQTSGMPNFLSTAMAYGDTTRLMDHEGIIALIEKVHPTGGTPGEKFFYNNSNYLLCRSIIRTVSGMSYEAFIQKHLWDPLGMNDTQMDTIADATDVPITSDNFYKPGDDAINSTAKDLFRFAQALIDPTLVPRESVDEAFTQAQLNDGTKSNYGLGWYILETPEGKSVGHWGGGESVKAYLEIYLTEKKMLVMLSVNSTATIDKTYQAVRNIWDGKPYELPSKRIVYDIDPKLFEKYTGRYLTPNLGLLHVSTENGKLYLRPDPVPGKEELIPSSDSTFYFRNQDLDWQFYQNSNGEVIGFGFKGDRKNMGIKQN